MSAPATDPDESALRGPQWGRSAGRLALFMLALQAALLVHGAWRTGVTYDEHFYVTAGAIYLSEGDFAVNREHPPLVKYLAGAPWLLAGIEVPEHAAERVGVPVNFFYQRNRDGLREKLLLARLPFCALTVLTAFLVYRTARRWFGAPAGLLSLVLFGFNPNVLGHGCLVSLDGGVSALIFVAVLAFLAALGAWPGHLGRRALLSAVTFGLANLAKYSALLLGPFFGLLALCAVVLQRRVRPLAVLALTLLGGLGVFAAGYAYDACSLNAAWGQPQFVSDGLPPRVVTPASLAEHARELGVDPGAAERLATSPTPESAVAAVLIGLDRAETAPAAVALLAGLERGPGPLRKRAFQALLELPPGRASEEARVEAMAALCGRRYPTESEWRRFWDVHGAEPWDEVLLADLRLEKVLRALFGDDLPVPLFTALKGLDMQIAHGRFGHGSYFRGEVLQPLKSFAAGNPYPEYYATVFAVKNPLAAVVLFVLGVALAFVPARRGGTAEGGGWSALAAASMLGFPLLAFLVFSTGNALLGVRYLLPIFPFLAVLAGRCAGFAPRLALVAGLVAVLESAWIHPHELMYYNLAAGGPVGGPAITVVGDDWGQGVREVTRFHERNREALRAAGGLVYNPSSVAGRATFGLEDTRPHEGPVEGIVAVHALDYYREQRDYAWLRSYAPFERLGWSVYVYDTRGGPPGRDPRAEWGASR